jgi:hypothetical protein
MPGNALLFAAACAAGPGFGFVAANRHPECAERRKPRDATLREGASRLTHANNRSPVLKHLTLTRNGKQLMKKPRAFTGN